MTNDMRSGGSTSGDASGQQQFLVEQGGKVYVTQVLQEVDPQDERFQSALGSGEAGRAVAYSDDQAGMEYKSEAVSAAQIEPTVSAAQIDPNNQ